MPAKLPPSHTGGCKSRVCDVDDQCRQPGLAGFESGDVGVLRAQPLQAHGQALRGSKSEAQGRCTLGTHSCMVSRPSGAQWDHAGTRMSGMYARLSLQLYYLQRHDPRLARGSGGVAALSIPLLAGGEWQPGALRGDVAGELRRGAAEAWAVRGADVEHLGLARGDLAREVERR